MIIVRHTHIIKKGEIYQKPKTLIVVGPVRKSLEFKNLIVVMLTIYWVSFWSESKML